MYYISCDFILDKLKMSGLGRSNKKDTQKMRIRAFPVATHLYLKLK